MAIIAIQVRVPMKADLWFMRYCSIALLALAHLSAWSQLAVPENVPAPKFQNGSNWLYRIQTRYSGAEGSVDVQWTLLFQNKGGDWVFSRGRPIAAGADQVAHQISGITDVGWSGRDSNGMVPPTRDMLSFPLALGKTWQSTHEADGAVKVCNHKVVNWERVQVPAGAFTSLKIEYECKRGEFTTARVTQWYVPEVQNFVREVMQLLERGDDQNVFELLSYKIGK